MKTSTLENSLALYQGRKVLVTGHTGFKGSWLSIWLRQLGAEVVGIALDPEYPNSIFELSGIGEKIKDYRGDIRNKELVNKIITDEKPEIVFHLAAQPLVIASYADPLYTYEVNTLGTAYVLDAMKNSDSLKAGVFITTDKVYENKEWLWPYRESEQLGGYDPYSSSKAAAELIISSYRNSFFSTKGFSKHQTSIASVRAGNVIGGGDWAENRLVPDCIKSINNNKTIEIRSPQSVRPWQHVIEPLGGYLLLGAKMMQQPQEFNEAWNFGPESENIVNVGGFVDKLIEKNKKGTWRDTSNPSAVHEATLLSLDINKAKNRLGWKPILSFDETIEFTTEWYQKYRTQDVYQLSLSQIKNYTSLWKSRREN